MERYEVIEYLGEYHSIIREIRQLEEEAEALRTKLFSPQKPSLDGMPRSNFAAERLSGQVAKLADMDEEIQRLLEQLYARRKKIERIIGRLPSAERGIMRLRYICCRKDGGRLTWYQVAERANYSERQCQYIHRQAIEKIAHYCV